MVDGTVMGGVDVGRDSIVSFVERDLVREVGEHAVVEIGKRWLKVSARFFCYLDWN